MGAPNLESQTERNQAVKDLLVFIGDFGRLLDQQLVETRQIMEKTVEQMMNSVSAISDATDYKLKKADEVLVQGTDKSGFVSKSAKEIDSRFADPAGRVKAINEHISAHMATLSNLDDSVRMVLFSIMGALSMDDVIRQRIEHVTTSIRALESGISRVVSESSARFLSEAEAQKINNDMADKMYRAFTMEEEKAVFKSILGDIKNFRKS